MAEGGSGPEPKETITSKQEAEHAVLERKFKQGVIVVVMIMMLGLSVIGLFRYGAGALLGSGSDLGVFLAPFVLIFGIMAIIWLWFWFIKLIKAVK